MTTIIEKDHIKNVAQQRHEQFIMANEKQLAEQTEYINSYEFKKQQKINNFQLAVDALQNSREPIGTPGIMFPRGSFFTKPAASFFGVFEIEQGETKKILFSASGENIQKGLTSFKTNFSQAIHRCRLQNKTLSSLFAAGKMRELSQAADMRDSILSGAAASLADYERVSANNCRVMDADAETLKAFLSELDTLKASIESRLKIAEKEAVNYRSEKGRELSAMRAEYEKAEQESANVLVFDQTISTAMIEGDIPDFIDDDDETDDTPKKRK